MLFVSGCLLRCTYCHNPDTWHLKDGTYVSADQVLRRLGDFAPSLRSLGGGLTISGGEPMVQLAFTEADLRGRQGAWACTRRSRHPDSSATAPTMPFLSVVDLVLLDIKSSDPDTYRRVTGRDIAPTLRFAERLASMIKAGLGPLHARARRDRRSRECRRHRPLCRAHEERRMGRGAAVPSDGCIQVEGDGSRLQASRYASRLAANW